MIQVNLIFHNQKTLRNLVQPRYKLLCLIFVFHLHTLNKTIQFVLFFQYSNSSIRGDISGIYNDPLIQPTITTPPSNDESRGKNT